MQKLILTLLVAYLFFTTQAFSKTEDYTLKDVSEIVPQQTSQGWWHKQFSSMPGNRYLTSFQSTQHKGKLSWDRADLKAGKIQIVKAMQLAKQWSVDHAPFGENVWEIESVTFRFRSGKGGIEYMCAITLKTPDYKTVEVIILPNQEIIPPEIDPQL